MDHSWGYGSEQRNREKNEDCYGVFDFPEYTLAVVCDGMGGHVGGAHASTLAVRTIHDAMRELQNKPVAVALEEAIQRTNLVIYESARKNHRLTGMGTTVVAAVIGRDSCLLAHVGDSRAYLVRRGQVQLLTRDHTMVNLFVDAELLSPEDAATHPEAHVLSRSLGVERQVEVDLSDPIPLEAGDVVFLCSDGIHGVVTDWELGNVDWGTPHEATQEILRIVTSREGDDNATAVSVMMGGSIEDVPPTPVPEPRRFDEAAQGAAGATAVPLDEEVLDEQPRRTTPHSGSGGGYAVYDDPILEPEETRPLPEPAQLSSPPQQRRDMQPPGVSQGGQNKPAVAKPAQPPRPKPAAPKPRSRSWLPAILVGMALFGGTFACGVGTLLYAKLHIQPSLPATDGLSAQVDPVPGDPVAAPTPTPAPAAPETVTPEQQWSTAEQLRKTGDLSAAADLLRQLIATTDSHPYGDRALLALLDVEHDMLTKTGHAPDAVPTDAPVEQIVDNVKVYSLTPDRRAWVTTANVVLSHSFVPPTDLSGPNLAKQTDEMRPQLLLDLGEMLCRHNRYDESRTKLRYLQESFPNSKAAQDAKNLPKLCLAPPENASEVYPCPTGGMMLKNELPQAPRRMPQTPIYCNQPPPGGQYQNDAIQRQRAGDCPASLTAVQEGMKVSPDHCRLYQLAWSCFSERDMRKLESGTVPLASWDDIVLVLPLLEGGREKREAQAQDPKWSKLPAWYREAPDGVEFRLEAWSKDAKMQESTADLFGAPTVADQLAKDLFVEGRIAVQLACMPPQDRTSKLAIEEAWARRVYVLARALHGPAGVLIKDNRTQDNMQGTLRAMLNRAVTDYVDPQGHKTPIPDVVRYAYDVGIENRPPPTPVTHTSPDFSEPTIRPDDDLHITVEKGAGQ